MKKKNLLVTAIMGTAIGMFFFRMQERCTKCSAGAAGVVAVLYFLCKKYSKYKFSHPKKAWLSYF